MARRLAEGTLTLQGMYFHVGEAQAYLLAPSQNLFDRVVASPAPGGPHEVPGEVPGEEVADAVR